MISSVVCFILSHICVLPQLSVSVACCSAMWLVVHVSEDVDKLWVKAKECGYIVTQPSSPQVDRKHFDLEKKQRQLEEEAECRRALRERDIPPYFDSDVAACFEKLVCGCYLVGLMYCHIGLVCCREIKYLEITAFVQCEYAQSVNKLSTQMRFETFRQNLNNTSTAHLLSFAPRLDRLSCKIAS